MTRNNIAFLSSVSDVLLLHLYIKEHKLEISNGLNLNVFIYGTKKNSCEEMLHVARFLFPDFSCQFLFYQEIDIDLFLSKLNQTKWHTLFMSHLFGKFESRLLQNIKREKVVLIENGIATYFLPKARSIFLENWNCEDLSEAVLPLSQIGLYPQYLEKYRPIITFPSKKSIFEFAMSRIGSHEIFSQCEQLSSVKFVVGTSLYRLGVIREEDEMELYSKELRRHFDGQIIYKPHPRGFNNCGLLRTAETTFVLDTPVPLELFAAILSDTKKVTASSIASSSLLILKAYAFSDIDFLSATLEVSAHPHLDFIQKLNFI